MNSRVLTGRATSRGSRAEQILGRSRRASRQVKRRFCACLKAPHRVLTGRATSRGSRAANPQSVKTCLARVKRRFCPCLKAPHRVLTERATSRAAVQANPRSVKTCLARVKRRFLCMLKSASVSLPHALKTVVFCLACSTNTES
ncbi:hypothetical protein EVAR_33780_1 [Eumeta japonica]|uniref:Uncharacterized protein n=1 Tax=Eumeta variegata TaxID=151549 RepID=A0A4C1VS54_EUMVA|nr:hypothetical protein EVAR_33780_1 [Eumeta japonica]